MNDEHKRPVYEPPVARDLSDPFVTGDDPAPMGLCMPGTYPWTQCVAGGQVSGGTDCNPVGNFQEYPKCQVGSNALVGCTVGTEAG